MAYLTKTEKGVIQMGLFRSEYPEIFKHLHPVRNVQIDYNTLKSHSSKEVWWYCEADPEYSHFFVTKLPTGPSMAHSDARYAKAPEVKEKTY